MQYILSHQLARDRAIEAVRNAPEGYCVKVTEQKRTLDQNAMLWPLLTDIAEQVEWHGQHLTKEEWKDMFTAALKRQKVVAGIDGGFVVLGAHTSKLNKKEFSDLLELIQAFGAEQGVRFSEQD